jgi:hypothetical protein
LSVCPQRVDTKRASQAERETRSSRPDVPDAAHLLARSRTEGFWF